MQRVEKNSVSITLFFIAGILVAVACATLLLPLGRNQKIDLTSKIVTAYDDRLEKDIPGNSEILSIAKDSTALKIRYILKKGFTYPYAGVKLPLTERSGTFFDCSRFDKLKIRIASTNLSDCKLYLKVFDERFSRDNEPLTERYLEKDLVINPVPETFSIPLKEFITPEWWYQKNNITLKDVETADLSKVTSLQIESGPTAKTGIIDTLTVSQICLTKSPNRYTVSLCVMLLAVIILYALYRVVPRKKSNPIIITYEKKEISSYRDIDAQRISDYVAEHFSDPELSILTMGRSLGLSQKKAVKVLKDVFKMSFKQYLTSIRIHEAKRLLRETDRLVIDIALAVGFNSISHFNRVFKASTKVSPLEFRNRSHS